MNTLLRYALGAIIAVALSVDVRAAEPTHLTGPVDFAMLIKVAQSSDPVEIASPGGNMLASMAIAQSLKDRHIPVRVTGYCASGCAFIAIGSGHCTVARAGRLVLHGPVIAAGLTVTDYTIVLENARTQWKEWARDNGVPEDLIFNTFQAYRQQYELSEYAMKRVGCVVE